MQKAYIAMVILLFKISSVVAQNYDIVYQISNFYDTSLKARITVNTKHLGPFTLNRARQYNSKSQTTDKQVICADTGSVIPYNVPQVCSQVYWTVDFYRQPKDGVRGSTQSDVLLNNNQWLLTESGNFPRFSNVINAAACVGGYHCQALADNDLPLFFVWGKTPTIVKLPKQDIKIYTDKAAQSLDKKRLAKALEPGFDYIYQVFNNKNVKKRPPLTIIWLARSLEAKTSGGLAGYNAFLANYYVDEKGKLDENSLAVLIKVSLHEYMHVSSAYRFTIWIEESLADYYAFKAMRLGKYNEYALNRWLRYKKSSSHHLVGLYTASNKFRQGKYSYRKLFYVKGAAFWNEIDRELIKQGQSLDQYIYYLADRSSNFLTTDNPALPQVFINKVSAVIGNDTLNHLMQNYLE